MKYIKIFVESLFDLCFPPHDDDPQLSFHVKLAGLLALISIVALIMSIGVG